MRVRKTASKDLLFVDEEQCQRNARNIDASADERLVSTKRIQFEAHQGPEPASLTRGRRGWAKVGQQRVGLETTLESLLWIAPKAGMILVLESRK